MNPVSKTLISSLGLLLFVAMETEGFSVCPVIPPFVNNLCSDTVSSQRDKSIFIENHRFDQTTRCHCSVKMDPSVLSSETVRFVLLTSPVNGNYCPGMDISVVSEGRRIFTFDCKKAAFFVPITNPQASFHVQALNTEQKEANKSAICISMSARVTMTVDCSKTSLVPVQTGSNAPIQPMMMNTTPQPWASEAAAPVDQNTQQPINGGSPARTSPAQNTATIPNIVSKPYIRLGGRLTDTNPTMRSLKALSSIAFPRFHLSNGSPTISIVQTGLASRKVSPQFNPPNRSPTISMVETGLISGKNIPLSNPSSRSPTFSMVRTGSTSSKAFPQFNPPTYPMVQTGLRSRQHAPAIAILHVRTRRDETGLGRPFLPPQLRKSIPTTPSTTATSEPGVTMTTSASPTVSSKATPNVTIVSTTAALAKSNASYKLNGQGSNRLYVGTHSAVAPVLSNVILIGVGLVVTSYLP